MHGPCWTRAFVIVDAAVIRVGRRRWWLCAFFSFVVGVFALEFVESPVSLLATLHHHPTPNTPTTAPPTHPPTMSRRSASTSHRDSPSHAQPQPPPPPPPMHTHEHTEQHANGAHVPLMTSEEVNVLVHAYLQESGFTHAAFSLVHESPLKTSDALHTTQVPTCHLLRILQKGLLYLTAELAYRGQDVVKQPPRLVTYDLPDTIPIQNLSPSLTNKEKTDAALASKSKGKAKLIQQAVQTDELQRDVIMKEAATTPPPVPARPSVEEKCVQTSPPITAEKGVQKIERPASIIVVPPTSTLQPPSTARLQPTMKVETPKSSISAPPLSSSLPKLIQGKRKATTGVETTSEAKRSKTTESSHPLTPHTSVPTPTSATSIASTNGKSNPVPNTSTSRPKQPPRPQEITTKQRSLSPSTSRHPPPPPPQTQPSHDRSMTTGGVSHKSTSHVNTLPPRPRAASVSASSSAAKDPKKSSSLALPAPLLASLHNSGLPKKPLSPATATGKKASSPIVITKLKSVQQQQQLEETVVSTLPSSCSSISSKDTEPIVKVEPTTVSISSSSRPNAPTTSLSSNSVTTPAAVVVPSSGIRGVVLSGPVANARHDAGQGGRPLRSLSVPDALIIEGTGNKKGLGWSPVLWHPSRHELAASQGDLCVRSWEVPNVWSRHSEFSKESCHEYKHNTLQRKLEITSMQWNHDGTLLATGADDGVLRVFGVASGLLAVMTMHQRAISCIRWTNNNQPVTGSLDNTVCLWNSSTQKIRQQWSTHQAGPQEMHEIEVIDDENFISCPGERTIHIISVGKTHATHRFRGHPDDINIISINPTRTRLASGGDEGEIRVWSLAGITPHHPGRNPDEVEDGEEVAELDKRGGWTILQKASSCSVATGVSGAVVVGEKSKVVEEVVALAWGTRDGGRLLSSGSLGTVKMWDVGKKTCLMRLTRHSMENVCGLGFQPHCEEYFATAGTDGILSIWRVMDGALAWEFKHDCAIYDLVWHPSRLQIAVAGENGRNAVIAIDSKP